jgi:hypothetical protein
MAGIRSRLAAVAWLLVGSQLAGIVSLSVSAHCGLGSFARPAAQTDHDGRRTSESVAPCCKAHGPGAACPMERGRQGKSRSDRTLRSACGADGSLAVLLGIVGLPAATRALPALDPIDDDLLATLARPLELATTPHAPPPKA